MKKLKFSSQNTPNPDKEQITGDHGHTPVKTKTEEALQVNKHAFRQTDPLKIDLVLERIFHFSSVGTLKNCRLVCTKWRDISLKTWRNNAILVLMLWSDVDAFDGNHFNFTWYRQLLESDKSDDDNDATLRNLKKFPFNQFRFVASFEPVDRFADERARPITDNARVVVMSWYPNLEADPDSYREIDELRNFFKRFKSLETLHFSDCFDKEYNFVFDAEVEDVFDFKLPKMKHLTIRQDSGSNAEVWGCILKWFPNLETLSLEYKYMGWSTFYSNIKRVLASLKNIRQSGGENVLALKELEIDFPETNRSEIDVRYCSAGHSDEEIMQTIIQCNFPLQRLSICLGWKEIRQLLKSCKDTLQYLKTSIQFTNKFDRLMASESNSVSSDETICTENVMEASLGNGHHHALHILTHLDLPNLQKLTIEKDDSGTKSWIFQLTFPKGRVYEHLETLEFLDNLKMPSRNAVEALITLMPNLAHLTIPLDPTTFQIVCDKLKGLKTLNILSAHECHEELNDETLTGVSKDTREGENRPPNITDLALLTDLKISCHWPLLRNDVKFTDHSVIHGFLHLPRLYSLSIAFRNLSEDVKAKLLKHVKGNVEIQERPPVVEDCCILKIGKGHDTNPEEVLS